MLVCPPEGALSRPILPASTCSVLFMNCSGQLNGPISNREDPIKKAKDQARRNQPGPCSGILMCDSKLDTLAEAGAGNKKTWSVLAGYQGCYIYVSIGCTIVNGAAANESEGESRSVSGGDDDSGTAALVKAISDVARQEAEEAAKQRAARLLTRPNQIAQKTGYSTRQIKDAIHAVKNEIQGGFRLNPDVGVDINTGETYVQLPGGGMSEDSIGNIFDYLPEE